MLKKSIVLVAGIVLLSLSGCNLVVTDRPIGDPLPEKEIQQLVGKWLDDLEGVVVEIRLSSKNEIILGALEWNEDLDQFKAEQHTLEARLIGANKYLFYKGDEGFSFCLYQLAEDGKLEIWIPEPTKFKALLKESQVVGTLKESSQDFVVQLKGEESKNKEVLAREKVKDLLMDKPLFQLRRLSKN